MDSTADRRGVLYPARLPEFQRILAPQHLRDRVGWFWVARWNIAPGRTSRQELLPFPCMNLVIQPTGVTLAGISTGASHRDLTGNGWVLAALLLPASIRSFGVEPRSVLGSEVSLSAEQLLEPVRQLMDVPFTQERLNSAVDLLAAWLEQKVRITDQHGLTANKMLDLVAQRRDIVNVVQLAVALGLSVRSLQRLSSDYVGLTPLTIIRRYRLQEAAQRLRENPSTSITQIAAELEYADHAHLTKDFRQLLGFTPSAYRAGSTDRKPSTPLS
ncbi:DNA-binding protein [Arthrobacter sp. MYb213]|nr:DNA-binding protein [Arthrobacter sp. MYb213]